jgi:glycosyltransferase involved in cell wall biosynthesis
MRIVHVLQRVNFHDGGPPRAVVDLCSVQHERGHAVTLLTTDTTDVPEAWQDDGPDVCVVPEPRWPGGLFAPGQLDGARAVLKAADVVHCHAVWERMNAQIAKVCRAVGTPYVITLRGMLDDWCMGQGPFKKRLYLSMMGRTYLEGAAFVHCTAEGEREQSHKWFPRGTPRVIPNLIDLAAYAALPMPDEAIAAFEPLQGEGPTLLFLSRIHAKKGIEHLVDALPALRRSFPALQVLLAGTGDDAYIKSLQAQARRLGVDDAMHWLGHVGGTLKLSLYNAADIFVLPSSQENFGFVQFEAMACATPCMTTKLVDTWQEVESSGGGIAVEQSADSIIEGLTPLLQDADRRGAMGTAGRAWVLEHLATDRVAALIEDMYQDAADGR